LLEFQKEINNQIYNVKLFIDEKSEEYEEKYYNDLKLNIYD